MHGRAANPGAGGGPRRAAAASGPLAPGACSRRRCSRTRDRGLRSPQQSGDCAVGLKRCGKFARKCEVHKTPPPAASSSRLHRLRTSPPLCPVSGHGAGAAGSGAALVPVGEGGEGPVRTFDGAVEVEQPRAQGRRGQPREGVKRDERGVGGRGERTGGGAAAAPVEGLEIGSAFIIMWLKKTRL